MVNSKERVTNLFCLLALIIFSLLITRSHTPYGAAMSMDSLSYLNAAQQFTLGHGVSLSNYNVSEKDYKPMTLWPPLYPLTLAAFIPSSKIFNAGADLHIAWINAFFLSITTILFWFIGRKFIGSEIACFVSLLLVFLPSMQVIYMYGWSETLFIPVVLAAFYLQWKFFVSTGDQRLKFLCVSVLMLAIGFYTRYASLGFLGGFLVSVAFVGNLSLRQRLRCGALSVAIFLFAIAPLLARNYFLTSTLVGNREKPVANFTEDFELLCYFLKDEFFPFPTVYLPIVLAWLVFVFFSIKKLNKKSPISRDEKRSLPHSLLFSKLSFLWCLTYLAFLLVNRQLSIMDLDPRMVAPTLPFIILGISVGLNDLARMLKPIVIFLPCALLVVLLLFRSYGIHSEIMSSWRHSGEPGVIQNIQYKTALNRQTQPLQALQKSINLPVGAVLLTDIEPASFVQYFFPLANVKLLPKNLTVNNLQHFDLLQRAGLLVVTKRESIDLFNSAFKESDTLFQLEDKEGLLSYFVLMSLPVGKSQENRIKD
jgi:hypothetical protein